MAAQTINEAEAYKEVLIKNSEGEAARFTALYNEYRLAKKVTKKRLYLETMEKILPKFDKMIVDTEVGKKMLPYLPLESKSLKPATSRKAGQ